MPYIKSSNIHSDHVIVGDDLSLNCSVNMDIGISFKLNWEVPNKQKLKVCYSLDKFI